MITIEKNMYTKHVNKLHKNPNEIWKQWERNDIERFG